MFTESCGRRSLQRHAGRRTSCLRYELLGTECLGALGSRVTGNEHWGQLKTPKSLLLQAGSLSRPGRKTSARRTGAGRAAMRAGRQAALLVVLLAHSASAAVHSYNQELFYSVSDAFIYRGGRQGALSLCSSRMRKC